MGSLHAYVHMHTSVCRNANMFAQVATHVHIYTYRHKSTPLLANCKRIHTHACMYTRMCMRIHTYVYIHTYIHTYIYMCTYWIHAHTSTCSHDVLQGCLPYGTTHTYQYAYILTFCVQEWLSFMHTEDTSADKGVSKVVFMYISTHVCNNIMYMSTCVCTLFYVYLCMCSI